VRHVEAIGFTVKATGPLQAMTRQGLWGRVHAYRRPTPLSVAGYAGLLTAGVVLNAQRWCDIFHVVAVASERPAARRR
jgi:hypothetical protein